jgi:hypothetical protein
VAQHRLGISVRHGGTECHANRIPDPA